MTQVAKFTYPALAQHQKSFTGERHSITSQPAFVLQLYSQRIQNTVSSKADVCHIQIIDMH